MSTIIPFKGKMPQIDPSVFLAEGSRIIGDVKIGRESSVWFNVVIRGDVHFITIGDRTNVQDGCVLHVTHDTNPLIIGSNVTIGHGAVLHGCTIEDNCLIGMGAIVLDGAHIRSNSIVAAGALVLQGVEVPKGSLVAGVPAKVKKSLSENEQAAIGDSADNYVRYVQQYLS